MSDSPSALWLAEGVVVSRGLVFREALLSDIPRIMEIRFLVTENELSDPSKVTAEMCEQYHGPLGRGWVCEVQGQVVGFSYAAKMDSSIWALFVLPAFEGQGIGRGLLNLATNWLFSLGNEEVSLLTMVNTRADRFYAAQGWERDGMKSETEVCYRLQRQTL
ncbi:GNAT family N-acetyltransferase [Wenzhouxiangella sp. XN201]|uniref:GNAT family N-acetyltransferase n=1 Tax=Wenzhouxiangella sp. XN201 TaxID=2710755 RepID=UPI0013C7FF4C|nr:GNAT family N-acetyltransferase [Wenzhouxiangella sp. XN201]NEZ03567.1 GNAT family N-acetyltransferase [Wenzhouxiangella sp. XN201]